MARNNCFAHSVQFKPEQDWEGLHEHLEAVARRASTLAGSFSASGWGELAGWWHDVGKYDPEFQKYIRGLNKDGPPHAWAGAVLAATRSPKAMVPIAFAIAGHHTGLSDLRSDATAARAPGPTPLLELMQANKLEFARLRPDIPNELYDLPLPALPAYIATAAPAPATSLELFTRFVFSALVDADRLETSRFYARHTPVLTADNLVYDAISVLRARLDASVDNMPPKGSPAVVELRRQVLFACRERASDVPGRFSLTVPTGGGKTLSAMSFALRHAERHGLRRVVVVIPYTSIIEQSARVYREVLGNANVLEHQSNIDEQKLTEQDARGEQFRKLAAENWDAPIVVTTTVQFFESLLSNHPSRCRKLHNLARSVVLLDEVQTLPPQFLRTILDVLSQLTDHYGSTVVLATATPPALVERKGSLRGGLTGVREIMTSPSELATVARRVRVEWRVDSTTSYESIAAELRGYPQVLAIVHRRDDARRLVELLGPGALHLSAAMCPAHRLQVVAEVRRRLALGDSCQLISTQLIEAGVDVDFPVVYRSLAGLDSIAQSAGRCDREGNLTARAGGQPAGRMVVFRAETDPPPGVPRKALESMHAMLALGGADPFEPSDSVRYFDELYGKIDSDQHGIEPLRRSLMFAAVADRFRLIDDDTRPVVVPWGEAALRLNAFRATPNRQTQRALQPFIVQVRRYVLEKLRAAGVTSPVDELERFDFVNEGREGRYDERFGLDERDVAPGDVEGMIV